MQEPTRTGKSKKERAKESAMKWQKKSLERVTFVLNVSTNPRDKAIAEHLKSKANKGAYVKELIAKDMGLE